MPSLDLACLSIVSMRDEDYCEDFCIADLAFSVSFPQSNLWLHLHYVTGSDLKFAAQTGGGWRPTHHDAVKPSQRGRWPRPLPSRRHCSAAVVEGEA